LGCAFEFGEGGEVAVDDAVADLEEGGWELESFSGREPGGLVPDEVDLGVCEAGDESRGESGKIWRMVCQLSMECLKTKGINRVVKNAS
jgi:hypothetical protein